MKGFTFGSKNNELLIYIGLILPVVGAILYIYIYSIYVNNIYRSNNRIIHTPQEIVLINSLYNLIY